MAARSSGQIQADFDEVEQTYGVDRYIVTSIWGVRSNFDPDGRPRVLSSTATFACIGRRQPISRTNFCRRWNPAPWRPAPRAVRGSWAGAFGPTQFMPTSFKRYAVDFDGDGRRDVVDNPSDLIASTANNFKKDGWVRRARPGASRS